jgi:hypothetical protein
MTSRKEDANGKIEKKRHPSPVLRDIEKKSRTSNQLELLQHQLLMPT